MALVFFDVDHTLVSKATGLLAAKYYIDKGRFPRTMLLYGAWFVFLHLLNAADERKMMRKALEPFVGDSVEEVQAEMFELFEKYIKSRIYREAVGLIREHEQAGDRVILLTGTSKYITTPIAAWLGVEFVASAAVEEDGKFTEQFVEPIPYKDGKLVIAGGLARKYGQPLADAYFYTDSLSDLPLLEAVGAPRPVNPGWRLRRLAGRRGWPVLQFAQTLGENGTG